MKKGFERLKGVAAASAMGLGMLAGGGSARAATVTLPITVHKNGITSGAEWLGIRNAVLSGDAGLLFSSTTTITTSISTFATTLGVSGFVVSNGKAAFVINSARLVTGSSPGGLSGPRGAFDGGLWLAVDQTLFVNPDATVDLTGDVLTADTISSIVPNIDANIRYYFAPNRNVVRALYTLTNTSAGDVTAEVRVGGNLSSDGRTTIQVTSNGDAIIEDADLWHVTNGSRVVGVDNKGMSITLTRCGEDAPVCPLNGVKPGLTEVNVDDFIYFYAVTVPANSTIRIMNFAEIGLISADLATGATDFETLVVADAAGLLTGLSATELSEIINYQADADLDGVGDVNDAFPNDATETVDTDADGVGDNTDVFPNDADETVDTDGDGVGDNGDAFPNDANETADTDGDGVGDNADVFPNDATETVDSDGDGVGDNADAFPDDASKTTASSGGSDGFFGIGSFSLSGLAVILGLLPVLRIRRKTKK